MRGRETVRALLTLALLLAATGPALAQNTEGGESGLPVPRFVSLKADKVNVRKGPGTSYGIAWVFERVGLPVEVIREYENWRQIRDSEGAEGWVLQNLLSGRRSALVLPWELKDGKASEGTEVPTAEIRTQAAGGAEPVAYVEAGTMLSVFSCDGTWCEVDVERKRGYILQSAIWGVYKGEVID